MSRRIRPRLAVGLLAAAAAAAPAQAPNEATYKGKPTAYWVERLGHPVPQTRQEAVQAVTALGPAAADAVPGLLDLLQDDATTIRLGALAALGQIGPAAKDAVPTLLAALSDTDPQFRGTAVQALGRVGGGEQAAIGIARVLVREGANLHPAIEALRRLGPAAVPALPTLTDGWAERDARTREAIAQVLGALGPAAAAPLAKAITDPDARVRHRAVQAFKEIGPKAAAALPDLRAALAGTTAVDVRVGLVQAVGVLGPDAVPVLVEVVSGRDATQVKLIAVHALQNYGPEAAAAVPVLIGALQDRTLADPAKTALSRVGPRATEQLVRRLGESDPVVLAAVADALAAMKPPPKGVIPDLIAIVKDGGGGRRGAAERVLVAIGGDAIPALLEATKDRDDEYSYQILMQICYEKKAAVSGLVELLSDPSSQVRLRAAKVLGMTGPVAGREALAALRKAAGDVNWDVRSHAAGAIRSIERGGPPGVEPPVWSPGLPGSE
jgi:HEAT repeat protein